MERLRLLTRSISGLANVLNMSSVKRPLAVVRLQDADVKKCAKLAAKDLKCGEIVAVPTDTIYGVACLVQIRSAVDKLYALKGRHPEKPISICLAEIDHIFQWAHVTVSRELLSELLPGPVTLCFDRSPALNPDFNPEARLVGIRVPDHTFVRQICRQVEGSPVALTSANVSQAQSCLEVSEFIDDLGGGLASVFDGGRLCPKDGQEGGEAKSRQGSTIIDLSKPGKFKVIRNGSAYPETVSKLQQFGLVAESS